MTSSMSSIRPFGVRSASIKRTRKANITYQMEKKMTLNFKVLVHYLKGMILRMMCSLLMTTMPQKPLKLRLAKLQEMGEMIVEILLIVVKVGNMS
ncbi:uncharacterized protein [Malus domestica]|uniref:uncharacterized protein isoform X3 n=1 Tax=Malus domestica TaxID=3750 RepID=UPI0039770150